MACMFVLTVTYLDAAAAAGTGAAAVPGVGNHLTCSLSYQ